VKVPTIDELEEAIDAVIGAGGSAREAAEAVHALLDDEAEWEWSDGVRWPAGSTAALEEIVARIGRPPGVDGPP
jgi:hypothetical protein